MFHFVPIKSPIYSDIATNIWHMFFFNKLLVFVKSIDSHVQKRINHNSVRQKSIFKRYCFIFVSLFYFCRPKTSFFGRYLFLPFLCVCVRNNLRTA